MDYMHCVLLGIVKQLLTLWIDIRGKTFSLQLSAIKRLSIIYSQFAKTMPHEFARRPRSFDEFKRFKATELRQLLLYTLPLTLKNNIRPKLYKHFLLLHCAIRLLCNPDNFLSNNSCAHAMIIEFVKKFKKLYGKENCSYNLHCLLHLADDCRNMQAPLDDFSCFKFENYLQTLKHIPKTGFRVLEQISNRMIETEKCSRKNKFSQHPPLKITRKNGVIQKVEVKGLTLGIRQPDNFCLIFINENFEIGRIIKLYEDGAIDMQAVINLDSIDDYPIDSKFVRMYKISGTSDENFETNIIKYSLYKKLMKVIHFKVGENNYFATMLHSNDAT